MVIKPGIPIKKNVNAILFRSIQENLEVIVVVFAQLDGRDWMDVR